MPTGGAVDDLFADPAPERAPADSPAVAQPVPAASVPYTWGEEWRHACEVRFVRAMPLERRTSYLEGVERKRGRAAMLRILEGCE